MKIQLTRSVQELLYSISARNTTFFRKFMAISSVEILHILKADFVNIAQIPFRQLLAPAASRGCAEPSALEQFRPLYLVNRVHIGYRYIIIVYVAVNRIRV